MESTLREYTTLRESEIWGFCRQHLTTLAIPTIRSIKCKQHRDVVSILKAVSGMLPQQLCNDLPWVGPGLGATKVYCNRMYLTKSDRRSHPVVFLSPNLCIICINIRIIYGRLNSVWSVRLRVRVSNILFYFHFPYRINDGVACTVSQLRKMNE